MRGAYHFYVTEDDPEAQAKLFIETVDLEPGDVEEGLRAAAAIGDDMIQKKAQGYVAPESWTHGSSDMRVRWFRRGFETGDPEQCDTFDAPRL